MYVNEFSRWFIYPHIITDVVIEDVRVRYYPEFSCEGRCGFDISAVFCHCDPNCETFKDCCFDYHQVCSHVNFTIPSNSISPDLFSCFPFDDGSSVFLGSFFIVAKCPSTWTNSDIRVLCEHGESSSSPDTTTYDFNPYVQTISKLPVFDENGNNYKNIFCAICNYRMPLNTRPWNVKFTIHQYNQLHGQTVCNKARITVDGNRRVGKQLRQCFDSTVDSCPESSNISISSACQSYNAITCPEAGVYAKNIHCAICNGFPAVADAKPCLNFQSFQGSKEPIFHSLWNFQGSLSVIVENDYQQCVSKEEILDPFTRKCRSLSCSPGYVYNTTLSSCQKMHSFPNAVDGMCCVQQQTWIGYVTEDDQNVISPNCVVNYLDMIIGSNDTQWEQHIVSKDSVAEKTLLANNLSCNIGAKLDRAILKSDYLLSDCSKYSLDYLHVCSKNMIPGNCNGLWFNDAALEFQLVNYTHLAEVFKYKDEFILPTLVVHYISYDYDSKSKSFDKTEIVLVCGNLIHPLMCPSMVTLSVDEYETSGESQSWITVLSNNLTLQEDGFILLPDGRLQICSSHLQNKLPQVFSYFGNLDTVNLIGSSVSSMAFVIILAVHCKLKVLRKHFHGRSIMFLSGALFVAYLLPILTQKIQMGKRLCYFVALLTHLSWLTAFSWFTVISLSMTYTFVLRPLERREVRETSVLYRLILSACGWGVPVAIVLLCLIVDLSGISGFSYGEEAPCWISGEMANLIAFGIPVGFSLLCSSLCFIATSIFVCRGARQRRKLEGRDERITWRDVIVTLKVCVIKCIVKGRKEFRYRRHLSESAHETVDFICNAFISKLTREHRDHFWITLCYFWLHHAVC